MNFNAKCPSNLKAVHCATLSTGKLKEKCFASFFFHKAQAIYKFSMSLLQFFF